MEETARVGSEAGGECGAEIQPVLSPLGWLLRLWHSHGGAFPPHTHLPTWSPLPLNCGVLNTKHSSPTCLPSLGYLLTVWRAQSWSLRQPRPQG